MKSRNWNRFRTIAVVLFGIATGFPAAAQENLPPDTEHLSQQAEELFVAGRYQDSISLVQRLLAIREQTLGPEHPDTAEALSNLALLYTRVGDYPKAEQLYGRSLAMTEKVLGPEHPDAATSLSNLAALYELTGRYAEAEPLEQRALSIREKKLGPEHPETAFSLNGLGVLYEDLGEYAKAETFHRRALTIREKALGPEHADTAQSLNNLAVLSDSLGAYEKSEPLYRRALAIYERVQGPEGPITATLLGNLARLYSMTGAHEKAEPLYQRALAINEKTLGPEHIDTAISLNNLAEIYRLAGAYTKAEPLYRRALAITEKVLGPEHPNTATSLNNIALLYGYTGAYAKAAPLLQRAIAIRTKALGPEHEYTAQSLNNLAAIYKSIGAYAKAESLVKRALAIHEKALGDDHAETAVALDNLATLYFARGAYAQAEPLNVRVQAIDERNAARLLYSGSESRKQLYIRQRSGRVSAYISLAMAHPTPRSVALGLTSVLQYKGRVLDVMSDSLARLRRSVAAQDRALLDQLATVAQEFSNLTYRAPQKLSTSAYRARLETLAQQQEELQGQLAARSTSFRETLVPITLETVRNAIPSDAVLVEWFRYQSFDPRAKLSAHSDTRPRYVAYVLKHAQAPLAIDIGEAQPIEALITKFRRALAEPTMNSRGATRVGVPRVDMKQLTAELSEKLIEPLSAHLSGSERLLISPDAALSLVPFAALLDEHGHYLAQHFEVSYLTSGRDLLRISDAPAQSESVMLAAPAYGNKNDAQLLAEAPTRATRSAELDRSGPVFDPLPGTRAEANAIQLLLGLDEEHVLTGDRATEAELRSLHGPRILHLATHGFFLRDEDWAAVFGNSIGWDDKTAAPIRENPLLRSGLALAGANERRSGDADDGILTAAEVAQLDLVGTQLVVLSACETALGTVDAGEGVFGLRRALALAGAQSQLVSLWKVDDAATEALMTQYYQRLLKGEGRAAALRSVQLSMLGDPAHQHPYYWAAFIPIGNWAPLAEWSSVQ